MNKPNHMLGRADICAPLEKLQDMKVLAEADDGCEIPRLVRFALRLRTCRNSKVAGPAGYIVGLLKTLGVPQQMLYVHPLHGNGSFWLRNINHLQVLERARQLYRKRIACVHPDKPGGSLEQTVQLNDAWGRIERGFKQHGHELW